MSRLLLAQLRQRRSVFYDDLSNMNPIYAAPLPGNSLWPLEAERLYHLRNLRLLALYFDHIVIMTGNLFNFSNYTTRAVVLEVAAARFFTDLVRSGVIVFCGWGSHRSKEMLANQLDYARVHRPELKDPASAAIVEGVVSAGEILVREASFGEVDLIDTFLEKLRLRSELSEQHAEWREIEEVAKDVQSAAGYLGTLEFFPRLSRLSHSIRREVCATYLDAWIDYSSSHYYPVLTYEIPRLRLNVYRAIRSSHSPGVILASILLSPDFFQKFILRFISEKEFGRLLVMPAERLVQLRNGDWRVFCEHYHSYLEGCSNVLWRIQVLQGAYAFDSLDDVFGTIIAETIRELPASIDATLFADFLSQVVGYCISAPGISHLAKRVLRPLAEFLQRKAQMTVRRAGSASFYPFISKMRTAIA